jgi:hypothetical protein
MGELISLDQPLTLGWRSKKQPARRLRPKVRLWMIAMAMLLMTKRSATAWPLGT